METVELISRLHRDSMRITEVLGRLNLDEPVPTCPGWTVRDLVHHLSCIQRWAADIVAEARTHQHWMKLENHDLPADADLTAWFVEGADRLVDTLSDAPDDVQCWVFMADVESPLHFWARRQSHEAAIHRVDIEAVAVEVGVDKLTGFDATAAADGVDEIVTGFWTRPNRGPRAAVATSVGLMPSDRPERWTTFFDDGGCHALRSVDEDQVQATVHGSIADLFVWTWDRPTLGAVTYNGDVSAIRRMKPGST